MRAIVIDAKNKEIREEQYDPKKGLEYMQKCVGGYIERGHTFKNGDEIYVNEEGLLEGLEYGFEIKGAHQPFLGNGVVVSTDRDGETTGANSEIDFMISMTRFLGA